MFAGETKTIDIQPEVVAHYTANDPSTDKASNNDLALPNSLVHEVIEETYKLTDHHRNENFSVGDRPISIEALDLAQILPYGVYFASYETGKEINSLGSEFGLPGKVVSHAVDAVLTPFELAGLVGNEAIDANILFLSGGHGTLYQGYSGTIVPSFIDAKAPTAYFPGVHADGKIDFQW